MSRPPIRTQPESGASRPATTRSSVDLPQPDGPSSTTNSPSRALSERRSTATLSPKRLVTPSIVNSKVSGAAVPAHGFGLPLLHLRRRQILLVGRDGPGETERILHMAVAVAPELIGKGESDRATGLDRLREAGVGIRHVEAEHHRPVSGGDRRRAKLWKIVGEHEHGVAD